MKFARLTSRCKHRESRRGKTFSTLARGVFGSYQFDSLKPTSSLHYVTVVFCPRAKNYCHETSHLFRERSSSSAYSSGVYALGEYALGDATQVPPQIEAGCTPRGSTRWGSTPQPATVATTTCLSSSHVMKAPRKLVATPFHSASASSPCFQHPLLTALSKPPAMLRWANQAPQIKFKQLEQQSLVCAEAARSEKGATLPVCDVPPSRNVI